MQRDWSVLWPWRSDKPSSQSSRLNAHMMDCKHQAENATRVARSFQLWELAPKPHTSSRRYTSPSTKQRPPTGGTSTLCHSSDLSSSSHTPSFSFLNLSLLFPLPLEPPLLTASSFTPMGYYLRSTESSCA